MSVFQPSVCSRIKLTTVAKIITIKEPGTFLLIFGHKNITINEICSRLKLSDSGVRKNLVSLRKKSIIERVGANKNGYWKIVN